MAGGDLWGNKSLKRNHWDKLPAIGTVKWKLPKNWHEDTWFKFLPAGQQGKLNVMPYHPIPTPVRSNIALLMATYQVLHVASLSKARRDIIGGQWASYWAGYWAAEWPISYFRATKSDFVFDFCLCTKIELEITI